MTNTHLPFLIASLTMVSRTLVFPVPLGDLIAINLADSGIFIEDK